MDATHRVAIQPGYVLHHYPYRNTSILAEVLSADHGRVGVVARGARTAKSPYFGRLQPFQPLLLSWTGRGELYTLTAAEPDGLPLGLSGRAILSGLYVNELLIRLLPRHDPQGALYRVYGLALARLRAAQLESQPSAAATAAQERVLRLFENDLLRELGYGLVLEHDVETGRPISADQAYCYDLESGPVGTDRATPGGVHVSGGTLLALAREDLRDREHLREAKRLMRAVLALYLGDRPLKSRSLFASMIAHGA